MAWPGCGRWRRRNCASGRFLTRDGDVKFNNRPIGRFWEVKMKLKALIAGTILATMGALTASAEDTVYVQLSTYRTGPYAGSGIPIANGMADYLTMLNERDGGV